MTKNLSKSLQVLIIATFLTGCQSVNKTLNSTKSYIDRSLNKTSVKVTDTKTVYVTCDKGDINEYTKDGWKVIGTESKKVTCTWKTTRSTPKCSLDFDKGCKVTVPDKTGEQIKYTLEKTNNL